MRLNGRTALVTGASGGIGAAIVRRFVVEGAQVVGIDVVDEPGEELAASLGPSARYRHCDVSDEDDVRAAVALAADDLGGDIDVLVNAAGIEQTTGYADTSAEEFDRIVGVNLRGPFLLCREVAPLMVQAGTGSIVNVSSTNGLVGSRAGTAYGASKGGLVVMSRDLAVELFRTGVRVNVVAPGTIDTPLIQRFIAKSPDPERAARMLERSMPIGRLGTPEEVANVVLFLASDEASLCTGAVFVADGGLTAQ